MEATDKRTLKQRIMTKGLMYKETIKRVPVLNLLAKLVYDWLYAKEVKIPGLQKGRQAFSAYLGGNRVLTKTVFGHIAYLDSRDISITPHLIFDGFWEKWITAVYLNLIEQGMSVVEVGANIGYYSLLAASKIGSEGRLYAFEANPDIYDILRQNIAVNGFNDRAEVFNRAASDMEGKISFHVSKQYGCSGSIVDITETSRKHGVEVSRVEVDAVTLDSCLGADAKVDLVKIDAEGSEARIIRGMEGILSNNHQIRIICEFSQPLIEGAGDSPVEFLNKLQALGFVLRMITPESILVEVSAEELIKNHIYAELYLTRSSQT